MTRYFVAGFFVADLMGVCLTGMTRTKHCAGLLYWPIENGLPCSSHSLVARCRETTVSKVSVNDSETVMNTLSLIISPYPFVLYEILIHHIQLIKLRIWCFACLDLIKVSSPDPYFTRYLGEWCACIVQLPDDFFQYVDVR
jgi:hypothetical protein